MKRVIQKSSGNRLHKKEFKPKYLLGFIAFLTFIGVIYFLVKDNYFQSQLEDRSSLKDTTTPQTEWKTYTNEQLGISIKYPGDLKIIEDEDTTMFDPRWYIGHYIHIANDENSTDTTKAIQIQIKNSLTYEVPWSGGKITTITKDNLDLYHMPGPNKTENGNLQGRPTMKSLDSSDLYGAHTKLTIIDGQRLIQIKVDTGDVTNTSFHDKVLSSFKFLN